MKSNRQFYISGNIFKKYKKEFVSLEAEGAILRSYKDDSLKSTNQQVQLQVSELKHNVEPCPSNLSLFARSVAVFHLELKSMVLYGHQMWMLRDALWW